ncbi:MAG TPA: type IV toxin-antitoxin system AbiEi family antitoxin domain-containing protein [Solirubrobacteraceae bacterium]|nr:type IV toxin-antitoxin system AbiEi family antitoxin domain-containing protein [Solirubrobacteraceae bacterium]
MAEFWEDERVRAVLRRQQGRVSWAQLVALGAPHSTIGTWSKRGRLVKVLPHVYAVGHTAPNREASLWEAILYAGPGSMLSHLTAAHRRGLINWPGQVIEVSTPRSKVRSTQWIRVHTERDLTRALHDGLPTTTVPQTLLDLGRARPELLPHALAQLDFRRQLNVRAIEAAIRGRPGSKAVREALKLHQPRLAYTNEEFEQRFLRWCERNGVPLPRFNVELHGFTVDAYWPEHNLVVELDGGSHASLAQMRRDRERDMELRLHGLRVVRYGWDLLHERSAELRADLMSQIRQGTLDVEARKAVLQPGGHVPVGRAEQQHQRRHHD